MKKIIYPILLILASCSSNDNTTNRCFIKGSPSKCPIEQCQPTYRTTADVKERVHKLSFQSEISAPDLIDLRQLAKEFIATKVRKISLSGITYSDKQIENINRACNKIKAIFEQEGLRESVFELKDIVIDPELKKNVISIKSYTYKVVLPTAEKWRYNVGDIDTTKKLPNFGTAMSYNLGCMIENPRDLVDPAEYPKVDGKTAVLAVRKVINGTTAGSSGIGGAASTISGSSSTVSSASTTSSF